MLAECYKHFEFEKDKLCLVYFYLNGNFEILSFEDFKNAIIYIGKSNELTQTKEGYLRHFAFNRVKYANDLKKISLVNCLNYNGDGKVVVFTPFDCLELNKSFFLESMFINLALNSNELPEATNMQVGKNVIIIKDEKSKSKIQNYLLEQAYSKFVSRQDSKDNQKIS